jgi:hypothetical protein
MDVYSRKILCWIFQRSIRKIDAINSSWQVDQEYRIKNVITRNDNESQFIANDVKNYLKSAEAK